MPGTPAPRASSPFGLVSRSAHGLEAGLLGVPVDARAQCCSRKTQTPQAHAYPYAAGGVGHSKDNCDPRQKRRGHSAIRSAVVNLGILPQLLDEAIDALCAPQTSLGGSDRACCCARLTERTRSRNLGRIARRSDKAEGVRRCRSTHLTRRWAW